MNFWIKIPRTVSSRILNSLLTKEKPDFGWPGKRKVGENGEKEMVVVVVTKQAPSSSTANSFFS